MYLDESADDEEFVEVPIKDAKTLQKERVLSKGKMSAYSTLLDNSTPGILPVFKNTNSYQQQHVEVSKFNDTKHPEELLEFFDKAPEVDWGEDLEYWSKEKISFEDVSLHSGLDFHHRYLGDGTPSSEKMLSSSTVSALRKRTTVIHSKPLGIITVFMFNRVAVWNETIKWKLLSKEGFKCLSGSWRNLSRFRR
jgi:hypothetical protein